MIGRALIRRGEIVLLIHVQDGELHLLPCRKSHDVDGGPIPATWRYRCTVGRSRNGPSPYDNVPAEGVLHLQYYSRSHESPWRGNGPLTRGAPGR